MRAVRLIRAALTLACVVVFAAPGPARATTPAKCITDVPTHAGTSIFPQLQSLGVRTWTGELSWRAVAPTRPAVASDPNDPAYQWPASLDATIADAVAHHVEPVLFVMGTPGWANGGKSAAWAPRQASDYAAFFRAAVTHYPEVKRWQVWSEPTKGPNFQPQGGDGRRAPRAYAKLLDAAWASGHAARSDVIVIGGNLHPVGFDNGTSTAPATFLRRMKLPNGHPPRLDMFGINPYTQRAPDIRKDRQQFVVDVNDLDWLLGRLDQIYPHRHLRLFVGEFGYQTSHGNEQWFVHTTRAKQAAYLKRAYRLATRLRRVDTFCWYLLYDMPPRVHNDVHQDWTTGLITAAGAAKPALEAFRHVASGPVRA